MPLFRELAGGLTLTLIHLQRSHEGRSSDKSSPSR
jgi:hypothetical protein